MTQQSFHAPILTCAILYDRFEFSLIIKQMTRAQIAAIAINVPSTKNIHVQL